MTLSQSVRSIVIRELRALQRELESYEDAEQIWQIPPGISNSAGTLALHLVGNLQAFIGAALGDTGYVRHRAAEFSRRNVPLAELQQEIAGTIQAVDSTLQAFSDQRFNELYPIALGPVKVETGDFLVHLVAHLAFHLGQVDYHRRLVTGDNRSIGPLALPELASSEPPE